MTVVIIGAGAIGRLFGVYLSKGGHAVTLVDPQQPVVDAINKHGLGFMEQGATNPDDVSFIPAQAVHQAGDIPQCDLVILTVKSFDTLTAIQGAAHLINETTPVLTLQTGLGNIEILERVVNRQQIIGGFTFMAATALGPGIVRHGGIGKTYIGELDGSLSNRLQTINTMLTECNLPCMAVQRIIGRLWCKVIVYAAINSATSILRVKNGRLLEAMESISLVKRLIDEGRTVAEAEAVDIVFHDLYELLFDACSRTDQNLSSMLQDILNGQQTEIDAQCGAIAAIAEQRGIKAPTQQTMVELIKMLQKRSGEQAF